MIKQVKGNWKFNLRDHAFTFLKYDIHHLLQQFSLIFDECMM